MVSEPCPISAAPVYTTTPPSRSILMFTVECGMSERMILLAAPLIVAARNSKAAALGQFASALLPPRPRNYLIDALRQPIAQHAKAVHRHRRRLQQIHPPYFSRIELECRGNLVHLRHSSSIRLK